MVLYDFCSHVKCHSHETIADFYIRDRDDRPSPASHRTLPVSSFPVRMPVPTHTVHTEKKVPLLSTITVLYGVRNWDAADQLLFLPCCVAHVATKTKRTSRCCTSSSIIVDRLIYLSMYQARSHRNTSAERPCSCVSSGCLAFLRRMRYE